MFEPLPSDESPLGGASWEARCLAAGRAYAEVLGEYSPAGLDGVSSEFLMEHDTIVNRVAAGRVAVVGSWDAHTGWASDGASNGAAWLACHTEQSRGGALAEIRVARSLRTMPLAAKLFGDGTLGFDKIRLLARASSEVPELYAEHEAFLLGEIERLRVDQTARFLNLWKAVVDPDHGLVDDKKVRDGSRVTLSQTFQGIWRLDGTLDPETGEALNTALQHLTDQIHRAEQATADATDDIVRSTPAQRRHDALGDLARMAMANERDGANQAVASITVILDADKLCHPNTPDGDLVGETETGSPVTAATAHRLCCDAGINRITHTGKSSPIHPQSPQQHRVERPQPVARTR